MKAQEPQEYVNAERRTEVLEALGALVEAALQRDPASRTATTRLDLAAARWSRDIAYPADVVTLVGEIRRQGRPSRRREDVLERVTVVAVAAVAERQVREALTDPLTGLATRARMEDELQHLLAMSQRSGSPLTAVILDVDGLKKVNDEQGHAAGDAALAAVGRAIREHARRTDRAFRWGGDEFLLLMPGTTQEDARQVVERIQQSCPTPTTAGIAMHDDGAGEVDVATWLSEADADLYRRRSAARATVPTQRRARSGRQLSGAALFGIATMAAATGGLFSATTAGHTGDNHGRSVQATGTTGSQVPTPPTEGSGTVPGPAIATPTAVEPVIVAGPAVHRVARQGSAPGTPSSPELVTPSVPRVVTPPALTPPSDPTSIPVAPAPEAQPTGLVDGLVQTLGGVLRQVVSL